MANVSSYLNVLVVPFLPTFIYGSVPDLHIEITLCSCRQTGDMSSFPICRFLQNKVESYFRSPLSYFLNFNFGKVPTILSKSYLGISSNKNVSFDQVPLEFREPFILEGYRPQSDFFGCIHSLFWLHNESFNCWSHILAVPIILFYFFEEYITFSTNPLMYLYLFSCLCFAFGSSFAHTFCCHNKLTRHASFTIDYIGLTIFACGCSIVYVYFSFPLELSNKSGLFGFSFLDTFLIFLCCYCMVSIFQSVWTRTLPPSVLRNVIRVGAFAGPGIIMSVPIMYKIINCYNSPTAYPAHYCDSAEVWPKQFLSCITAILFYISRFPECLYPGKFDYFGHSHNAFHIGSLLGLHYQKTALSLDLKFTMMHSANITSMQIPLACFSFLFLSILFTCIYFRHLYTGKPIGNSKRF